MKKDFKELIPILKELYDSSELREFRPLLEEMLAGAEVPDYNNIDRVLEIFTQNIFSYQCRKIAEAAYIHANTHLPPKKLYEDDD